MCNGSIYAPYLHAHPLFLMTNKFIHCHLSHSVRFTSLLLLILLQPIAQGAQQYIDLARVTLSGTPLNTFDSSTAQTRVMESLTDITLPIKIMDSLAIVTGFLYENLQTRLSENSAGETMLHGITLKVGINNQFNSNWSGTVMMLPKWSGDLVKVAQKDFQLGGSVILKYRKSDYFTWQFGGYYNGELFGPFFVPFLGCYYKSPSEKIEMNILLPAAADMNYSFTSKFRAGLSFISFAKSFHVHQQFGTASSTYYAKSTNEIFGYLQLEPVRGFVLQVRGGYSIARRFTLYDIDEKVDWAMMSFKFGDHRTKLSQWFADGAIFQLRLAYRFYT